MREWKMIGMLRPTDVVLLEMSVAILEKLSDAVMKGEENFRLFSRRIMVMRLHGNNAPKLRGENRGGEK